MATPKKSVVKESTNLELVRAKNNLVNLIKLEDRRIKDSTDRKSFLEAELAKLSSNDG